MERIDPTPIAQAILAAPAWARAGITAPKASVREDAAQELANAVIDRRHTLPPELDDG
ncbi:DUF6771 family protein [Novosphingobium terrae]|uniref:DUF6771 family protein n=1 Tax=Novosphingobium terrae TaxID=2726189 RepID=UPI00198223CC|nr:DUF6771 family protein [Novosphingobium terrae]